MQRFTWVKCLVRLKVIPKFRTGRANIYPPRCPAVGIYLPCVNLILHLIYKHFQSVNVYFKTIFCRWNFERCDKCRVGCISKEITQLSVTLRPHRITRTIAPHNDIHSTDVIKLMGWKFSNSKNACLLYYYSINWFLQRNPMSLPARNFLYFAALSEWFDNTAGV